MPNLLRTTMKMICLLYPEELTNDPVKCHLSAEIVYYVLMCLFAVLTACERQGINDGPVKSADSNLVFYWL